MGDTTAVLKVSSACIQGQKEITGGANKSFAIESYHQYTRSIILSTLILCYYATLWKEENTT
jgi:hypothetical protein